MFVIDDGRERGGGVLVVSNKVGGEWALCHASGFWGVVGQFMARGRWW